MGVAARIHPVGRHALLGGCRRRPPPRPVGLADRRRPMPRADAQGAHLWRALCAGAECGRPELRDEALLGQLRLELFFREPAQHAHTLAARRRARAAGARGEGLCARLPHRAAARQPRHAASAAWPRARGCPPLGRIRAGGRVRRRLCHGRVARLRARDRQAGHFGQGRPRRACSRRGRGARRPPALVREGWRRPTLVARA
mmetsp:Transcript_44963/g.149005  ORF Transcript_44963/g.149005 Transcript_44963/m.149005 type:complete len:201 (-) Transcript_44963:1339-1941(-)